MSMTSYENIPEDIWEEIISKFDHHDNQLQTLSLVNKSFFSIINRQKQTLKILEPTVHLLPSLLNRFPNIKHLFVLHSSRHWPYLDRIQTLRQFAKTDLRLETLDLCGGVLPMEEFDNFPLSMLTGVKSLGICVDFANDLVMIAKFFPNLEELNLCRADYEIYIPYRRELYLDYKAGISVMGSILEKSLKRINLNGNGWVNDRVLIALCEKCRNLEKIMVKRCGLTQIGIAYALSTCSKLNTIGYEKDDGYNEVDGDTIDEVMDDIHKPLSKALCLSEIDFAYIKVSDALLAAIVNADLPLKSFTLNECEQFTYAGIQSFLEKYNSLDHLALEGVDFLYDVLIYTLATKKSTLTKVRYIKLNCCKYLSDSTLITLFKQCPLLETVEMKNTGFGQGKGFRVIKDVITSQMRTLKLSFNDKLSDKCLEKISIACPNLETLNLTDCEEISGEGVGKVLRNCVGLKNLDINDCFEVHDLQLDRNIRLETLEASNTSLNDQALIDISKSCPDLMFLDLRNCQGITYSGVKEVVDKCTKLKEINLHGFQDMTIDIDMLHATLIRRPSLRKIVLPMTTYDKLKFVVPLFLREYGCYLLDDR